MKRTWLFLTLLIGILPCLFGCDELQTKDLGSKDSGLESKYASGNGDGYSGKVERVYLAHNADSLCPISQKGELEPNSIMRVIRGKAFLTRENCREISPREVDTSVIEHSGHNSSVVSMGREIFDEQLSPKSDLPNRYVEVVCRGLDYKRGADSHTLIDVVIRTNDAFLQAQAQQGSTGEIPQYWADIVLSQKEGPPPPSREPFSDKEYSQRAIRSYPIHKESGLDGHDIYWRPIEGVTNGNRRRSNFLLHVYPQDRDRDNRVLGVFQAYVDREFFFPLLSAT